MYIYDRQLAGNTFGQAVGSPGPYNIPGLPFDPSSDYVLAPAVMEAVRKLLSKEVPDTHLKNLGSGVNPLNVERGLTLFRYDNGQLEVGPVNFGASPRKETTSGSTASGGPTRYSVRVDFEPWSHTDANGKETQVPAWLFIHTHPSVQKFPGVPSGVRQENSTLTGDLYALRHEPTRQLGILTIGVNNVIKDLQSVQEEIPFTLALRDPIKGPTDLRPTSILATHRAAATAMRSMFSRRTVSGYFTGDLRMGIATPYLSSHRKK